MKYYKRDFLNKAEGMAAFEADITWDNDDGHDYGMSASFCITDCSRKVSLDFSPYGDEENNSFYKLTKLIEELSAFKEKFEEIHKARAEYKEAKEKDET